MLAELIKSTAVPTTNECLPGHDFKLNTIEVADFLAGFVHGFTGNDHKAYFEQCFKDNQGFENDICEVAYDFSTKDN